MAMEPTEVERMVEEARQSFTQPSIALHIAAFMMAMCGGMINAISFLDLGAHFFVSHLTGTTTRVGMRAAGLGTTPSADQKQEDAEEASTLAYAILVVVSFVIGSCFCGMIISRNQVSVARSAYGLVLLVSATLLTLAAFSDITEGKPAGSLFAAMACGIQNGMVTSYSGAIIRTTHVTGTWTDAGLYLGRVLSRLMRSGRKLSLVDKAYLKADFGRSALMFMLAFAFCLGCYLGGEIHQMPGIHKKGLLIPAAILASGGLGHALYVAFVLNMSFWQMLRTSSHNPQAGQALLLIDGKTHDLAGYAGPSHDDADKPELARELA
jgi:uncharacterized membrane protein YoaK (UPF0700 family)